jgi:antirestriction protein ArdC
VKEMTTEIEKKISEIIARVEDMTTAEYLQIIESMASFCDYSFNNKMLLAFQGCSQVASFKKWNDLGRTVKKGEKAKTILAPQTRTIVEKDEAGKEVEKTIIVGFRPVPVFDITQTEGEGISRGMTTKAELPLDQAIKTAIALGAEVGFEPLEIACGGYVSSNKIVLNSNLSEVENTGTLIHEIAHFVLGHTADTHTARDAKEQEAETVTALICAEFGIERKSEFYLKGWGTSAIVEAMPKMGKAYSKIKEALLA